MKWLADAFGKFGPDMLSDQVFRCTGEQFAGVGIDVGVVPVAVECEKCRAHRFQRGIRPLGVGKRANLRLQLCNIATFFQCRNDDVRQQAQMLGRLDDSAPRAVIKGISGNAVRAVVGQQQHRHLCVKSANGLQVRELGDDRSPQVVQRHAPWPTPAIRERSSRSCMHTISIWPASAASAEHNRSRSAGEL